MSMTRRERKEARIIRRQEWQESAKRESDRRFTAASTLADSIPLGQPILVGHSSEAHARRDRDRISSNMTKGCEAQKRAEHHGAVAGGIADQLDRSVFSDDTDGAGRLRERIAEREKRLTRMQMVNAEIRRGSGWHGRINPPLDARETRDLEMAAQFNQCVGYPGYALSNLRANIRRDQKRLPAMEEQEAQRRRAAEVLAAEEDGHDEKDCEVCDD
jgi:hypothetical protein